ncbi:hypothetical protein RN001_005473 [Aquatica leii]|uniref:Uncharacterized protein n=1 Tax=Aquatica leii TaxID=1421715 RepID=A0AAN7Q0F2_9COLE|nr:hypothetical protein RN001_005473 [Aquatica leii]
MSGSEYEVNSNESDTSVGTNTSNKDEEKKDASSKCSGRKKRRQFKKGEEYIGSRGQRVPARKQNSSCGCKKTCSLNITTADRKNIFTSFNKIGEKERQNSCLTSLVTVSTKRQSLCKMAICKLHRIGKKRLERICTHLTANITPPRDLREKHSTRPNALPENIVQQVSDHIRSFPHRVFHYSRKKSERCYLSADLSIKLMHSLYLKKHEGLCFDRIQRGEKIKPLVSYDYYYRYFKEKFNYSFGRARSDTCKTCDFLENKMKSTLDEEEEKKIEVLCIDFQQSLPLPKVPSTDAFYLRQLWIGSLFLKFTLLKFNQSITFDAIKVCYVAPLPLKDVKYKNVMLLASEYVAKANMSFYNSLRSFNQPLEVSLSTTEESDISSE